MSDSEEDTTDDSSSSSSEEEEEEEEEEKPKQEEVANDDDDDEDEDEDEDDDDDDDDDDEEEEELPEKNNNDDDERNNDLAPPSMDDPQESVDTNATTDLATDTDFDDTSSMIENDLNQPISGKGKAHQRGGSFHQRKESIQKQKELMERKLRQLSEKLDEGLDHALDEFQEMEQINEDKQVFSDLFDKIDPDDNGDVDEKEWIGGLKRLNVGIAESDMSKLFKLMDGDKSGYIDRQDWITFCMTSYQSAELQRLHDSVLINVKGHSRQPSNIFHANDVNDWSASAITNLEKQMTQAILIQGQDIVQKQQEEEEYFETMELEAQQNPDWAKPERATEWSPKEVAFWLDTIELSQYARKFDEDQLDGSILLNDVDRKLLQDEMGIKPLHVGKILREVDKLRKLNKENLQDSYLDWNELLEENKMLKQALQSADAEISELKTENAELRLKSISAVNLSNIQNPFDGANSNNNADKRVDDDVRNNNNRMMIDGDKETTKGGDDFNIDDNIDVNIDNEYKTDIDPFTKIKMLEGEIEYLCLSKIKFAETAADEINKLKQIIKVLGNEYTTLSTPYYKKINNPIDTLIRKLGYAPASDSKK